MDTPRLRPPRTPARRLAVLMVRLDRHRRLVEQRSSLRAADLRLLWLFTDGRPRTLREVADELVLEQSTVNRQVNAALRSGLLRRDREPGQQARLLSLTPEGLQQFDGDVTRIIRVNAAALAVLGPVDSELFLDQLERVVDAFGDAATE